MVPSHRRTYGAPDRTCGPGAVLGPGPDRRGSARPPRPDRAPGGPRVRLRINECPRRISPRAAVVKRVHGERHLEGGTSADGRRGHSGWAPQRRPRTTKPARRHPPLRVLIPAQLHASYPSPLKRRGQRPRQTPERSTSCSRGVNRRCLRHRRRRARRDLRPAGMVEVQPQFGRCESSAAGIISVAHGRGSSRNQQQGRVSIDAMQRDKAAQFNMVADSFQLPLRLSSRQDPRHAAR